MKLTITITFMLFLLLSGCRDSKRVNREELEIKSDEDKSSITVDRIVVPNDSGVVFIDLSDGNIKEKIRKEPDQTIFLEFNLNDTATIFGRLTSKDTLANIRFSQLYMPDGMTDGPFGEELEYNVYQTGTYRISVNENMMAGDPWGGVFTVKLALME